MPRVILNKEKYMLTDLTDYIRGEMRRQKITQLDLADGIGMNQSNFSKKLQTASFDAKELIFIFHRLGTDGEKVGRLLTYEKR